VIAHVVLFQPKPGLSEEDRLELIDALSAALREIPSVRRACLGPRITHGRPYEQLMTVDYSFATILEFDTVADLKAYLNHPVHERLATHFSECVEQALMYDFDVREGEDGLAWIRDAKGR